VIVVEEYSMQHTPDKTWSVQLSCCLLLCLQCLYDFDLLMEFELHVCYQAQHDTSAVSNIYLQLSSKNS